MIAFQFSPVEHLKRLMKEIYKLLKFVFIVMYVPSLRSPKSPIPAIVKEKSISPSREAVVNMLVRDRYSVLRRDLRP